MKRLTILMAILMTMSCRADYVTAEAGLNVRAESSAESEVIKVLPIGTEVDGGEGDWIPFEDGYISAEFVSADNPLEFLGEWQITAYCYSGCACADGTFPDALETIACNSLPFGTKVYIDRVGVRTVHDRGGSYHPDEWIDLYLGDYNTCIQWGRQIKKVWKLKGDTE